MAFLQDVSPFLFLTSAFPTTNAESLAFDSISLRFCHLLLLYATYCTIFKLCFPFSWFLIKFRLCMGIVSMLTMALRYDIAKFMPLKFVLGLQHMQHFLVRNVVTDILYYGLIPRTHKECRVLAYVTRL